MRAINTRPLIVEYDYTILRSALREQLSLGGAHFPPVPPKNPEALHTDLLSLAMNDRLSSTGDIVKVQFSEEALEFAVANVLHGKGGQKMVNIASGFDKLVRETLGHCIRQDVPKATSSRTDDYIAKLRQNSICQIDPVFFVATAPVRDEFAKIENVVVVSASQWRNQALGMLKAP